LTLANFNWEHLDELEEFTKEFLGWSANVHWEHHDELGGMFTGDVTFANQVQNEFDVGVGASNDDGVEENVTVKFLFNGGSLGHNLGVDFLNVLIVAVSQDFGNSCDLGESIFLNNAFLHVVLVQDINYNLVHEELNTTFHFVNLDW
jgi:hypothetical protein